MLDVISFSDLLLVLITLLWLISATIQDVKRREITNWLSFSLIIISLGIRAIAAIISSQANYFLTGVLSLGIFFIIAHLFYYARIFAGGDAKLLMALGTALATTPVFINQNALYILGTKVPFLVSFLVNMMFIGSAYGILYSLTLAAVRVKAFTAEFNKLLEKNRRILLQALILPAAFLIFFLATKEAVLLFLLIAFLAFPYLFIFVRAVENSSLVKTIPAGKLTEGDWLYTRLKLGKKVIMPNWEGLTKQDIEKIKKYRIKEVKIKQGIPFVPVFLLAFLISLYTNILSLLIQACQPLLGFI